MKKARVVSKKNVNNQVIVVAVVVVLLLIGVYCILKKNGVLSNMGLSEGFEGSPLNNLTSKPNPGPNDVVLVFFYADWCPHCVSAKPEFAKVVAKMNNTQVNGKNVKVQKQPQVIII
jgi:thiol-disulfide isomerase/thioredoxin